MSYHGVFLYFAFGTLLFFFWVYGIVSFVVDLRRQIIPWVRARWRERRDEESEEAATERLADLYGDPDDE
jgi:hypothetical protein